MTQQHGKCENHIESVKVQEEYERKNSIHLASKHQLHYSCTRQIRCNEKNISLSFSRTILYNNLLFSVPLS